MFAEQTNVSALRRKRGMSQSAFWSGVGVTQSGGSRYESGRKIPPPVLALIRLRHIEQIDIGRIKGEDFRVLEYLKNEEPELFTT